MSRFLVIISFLLVTPVFGQDLKTCVKYAKEAQNELDYNGAIFYFQKALTKDSSNTNIRYQLAESYRLANSYQLAIDHYTAIYSAHASDFQEALFWIATLKKNLGDYKGARHDFQKYYKSTKSKSSYFGKKAKQEVKSCGYAEKHTDTLDKNVIISSFIEKNEQATFAGFIKDESFISTSEIENKEPTSSFTIFKAELDGSNNVLLSNQLQYTDSNTANGTYSLDGSLFYYSVCDKKNKCKIYSSEIKNGNILKGKPMNNSINVEGFSATQPYIASIKGKEVLYFVSDRPRGKGQLDIWYTIITKNGEKLSRPKNLGKNVNTPDNELSPFYDKSTNEFYYSSAWHYGFGGYDIFKASGNLKPQKGENLGIPFNSAQNDLYYYHSSKNEDIFFTSNRAENAPCCNNIYKASYLQPDTTKTDSLKVDSLPYNSLEELNKYLPVTLYFHNDEPNPKNWDTTTTLTYLETYDAYNVLIPKYKDEYSNGLAGEDSAKAINDIEDFFIDYVDKGIEDLELFTELLLKELELGTIINLDIKGHASPLAKTDYNVNLTLRRISSLINQLSILDSGAYLPFINSGQLTFNKIPFGEYKSADFVSDNLNDQRNSVYSKHAALERKIEIVSVQRIEIDTIAEPEISFEERVYDFGTIGGSTVVEHAFKLTNTGDASLVISSSETSCGCTIASLPEKPIPPGESAEIVVSFNPEGKFGKQFKSVLLNTNTPNKTIELTITAEVK